MNHLYATKQYIKTKQSDNKERKVIYILITSLFISTSIVPFIFWSSPVTIIDSLVSLM